MMELGSPLPALSSLGQRCEIFNQNNSTMRTRPTRCAIRGAKRARSSIPFHISVRAKNQIADNAVSYLGRH